MHAVRLAPRVCTGTNVGFSVYGKCFEVQGGLKIEAW